MHVAACERYLGLCGIEVLIFKFADFSAVHGVGPFGAKLLDIEFVGALSYLFIGIEGNPYLSVFYFGMLYEVIDRSYDFGDARFVISSEQRVAVGHDEVLTNVMVELGKFAR